MASGPEHYREAERLLEVAWHYYAGLDNPADFPTVQARIQCAQVHATLALAAATALQPASTDHTTPVLRQWVKVAAKPPSDDVAVTSDEES